MSARKPLVVCPGAAKAGTTTLHALMAQHPEVAVTRAKETDFFVDPKLYGRGCDHYWNNCFEDKPRARVYFEADPIYMYANGCMRRVRECAPEARVVVMLRNPVDRAYSQYLYRMTYARYDETFEAMCARETSRIAAGERERLEYGCIDRSRYAAQIREILAHFPRERVYAIVFERFIRDQAGEFNRLLAWLGLAPLEVRPAKENAGGSARSVGLARLLYHPGYRALRGTVGALLPDGVRQRVFGAVAAANLRTSTPEERKPLDGALRRRLLDELAPDIRETEALTGVDLGLWLDDA
jgi:hypothetical protein